nr:DEAD/DEAH box helicase family protein [Anaerolineales bacterium]
MTPQNSEAFSRILIDEELKHSKWDLLDSRQMKFEYYTQTGRADYLLLDKNGRVLCVLEAKREDKDPYNAKEQARGYAQNLNAPFVILSNGREHWFWNLQRAQEHDAYRIERLPSQEDMERLLLKNLQPPNPLLSVNLKPDYLKRFRDDIKLRGYQIRALDAIAKGFDNERRRKFLLEMATGTGKTLLCAALIRL